MRISFTIIIREDCFQVSVKQAGGNDELGSLFHGIVNNPIVTSIGEVQMSKWL